MFNISLPEFVIIGALALLVLGPKGLPDAARLLGRALRKFRKATREVKEAIDFEMERGDLAQVRKDIEDSINLDLEVDVLGPDQRRGGVPGGVAVGGTVDWSDGEGGEEPALGGATTLPETLGVDRLLAGAFLLEQGPPADPAVTPSASDPENGS